MSGPEWMKNDVDLENRDFRSKALARNGPETEFHEMQETARHDLAAFEAELARVLRPVDLPSGFADRVVASVSSNRTSPAAPARARVLAFRSWRAVVGGAIAACLLAGFFGGEEMHQRRERQHATEIANQQFETATRITDEALEHTREQLRRAGVDSLLQ